MKKTILSIIILLHINIWGQLQLPNVAPPSPEAAQLAKFVETPVSLYNGTPVISLPITSINSRGVSVPITLIYDAKGIHVAEQSSRIGTGWSLNAGGLISRQIRGIADESNFGYMNYEFTEDFLDDPNTRLMLWGNSLSDDININVDFYPDLYYFNFPGYSGTFIFDHVTKSPVLQNTDDLQVIPVYHSTNSYIIDSWKLIDPQGVQYFFGDQEWIDRRVSQTNYKWTHAIGGGDEYLGNDSSGHYTNSWHLYKIITPEGDEIDFEYEKEFVFYYLHGGDQKDGSIYSTLYSRLQMQQCQLKSISHKNTKICFDKSNTTREDLSQGYALKAIRIVEKNGVSETVVKKYDLTQSYTTAPDDNNLLFKLKLDDNNAKKRLFLTGLNEISGNTQDTLRYVFEYNPISLPNRHSTSIDNWGYYNGRNNGEHLKSVFDSFDSRIVSETMSEAGMLKKIIYPTGGQTEFVYEQNKLKPPHFFSNLIFPKTNPITPGSAHVIQNPIHYTGNKYVVPLTIEGAGSPIHMSVNTSFDWTDCPEGVDSPDCRYEIYIKQNNVILTKLLRGQSNLTLIPGDYVIEAIPKQPHDPYDWEVSNFTVSFQWSVSVPDENELLYGPGKRIQKIIQRDGENIVAEKEYLYMDDNGGSSGQLFSIPAYHDIAKQIGNGYLIGGSLNLRATPVGLFIGNKFGYSKVTEVVKGGENNLRTEYYYTNFGDTGEFYKFPYHLPNDMGWTRGMPLEIKYYQDNGNGYSLIKKIKNKYIYYNNSNSPVTNPEVLENIDPDDDGSQLYYTSFRKTRIPIFKFGKFLEDLLIDNTLGPSTYLTAYYYAGRCNLEKTEEFDYFDNGTSVRTTTFSHEAADHNQMNRQTMTTSQNDTIETRYFYASDTEVSTEPHIVDLISLNMIGIPLKTEVYKNSHKLSTEVAEYENWMENLPNAAPQIMPEILKTAKGDRPLENRIQFLQYDDKGNPLEVRQENGTHIVYIWGYHKTKPVAKIENATYTQVEQYVANLQTLSNGNNESGLITALNNLRTNLPGAMVTTYTYKPLVGVSSITDPKGYTTTYHYDSFGRLEYVKDADGNILSENEYHYRTQN